MASHDSSGTWIRVASVGLDVIATTSRRPRGRNDHAVDPSIAQGSLEAVSGRARFVRTAQLCSLPKAIEGLQQASQVVGEAADVTRLAAVLLGYRDGD